MLKKKGIRLEDAMIDITLVWGGVGFAIGVCFATVCLTFAVLWDEYREKQRKRKGHELIQKANLWEKGMHDWDSLDQIWSVNDD